MATKRAGEHTLLEAGKSAQRVLTPAPPAVLASSNAFDSLSDDDELLIEALTRVESVRSSPPGVVGTPSPPPDAAAADPFGELDGECEDVFMSLSTPSAETATLTTPDGRLIVFDTPGQAEDTFVEVPSCH